MIKDTSTFAVIGLAEVVRVTQTINSQYFQPFVLYTAAAVMYVAIAFLVDYIFKGFESTITYPSNGIMYRFLTRKKRAHVQELINTNS